VRRLTITRALLADGLGHGTRAKLARQLGVSKSTLTADVRAILSAPGGAPSLDRSQVKEDTMSQRCTVRLPDDLLTRLQREVEASGRALSDVVREALVNFFLGDGQGADNDGGRAHPRAA
jgi:hypothetical protein